MFLEAGYRVVALDTIGYGGSEAPEELDHYTAKSNCAAVRDLIHLLNTVSPTTNPSGRAKKPILIGHDWGSIIPQRMISYHPDLVAAIILIAVPYMPINHMVIPLEMKVHKLPNFRYWQQFVSGEVEKRVEELGDQGLRNFVIFSTGGRSETGEPLFNPAKGIDLEALGGECKPNPHVPAEQLDYIISEFKRNSNSTGNSPLRGPLNYYRAVPLNEQNDKSLPLSKETKLTRPTLFIGCKRDKAVPPEMSDGQERYWVEGRYRRVVLDADHFVQMEKPGELFETIRDWIEGLDEGGKQSRL